MDKMKTNVDMLRMSMVLMILGQCDCQLVIGEKGDGFGKRFEDLSNEGTQP
jgi:hypothetical protein